MKLTPLAASVAHLAADCQSLVACSAKAIDSVLRAYTTLTLLDRVSDYG